MLEVSPDDDAALRRLLHANLAQHPLIFGSIVAFDLDVRQSVPYLSRSGRGGAEVFRIYSEQNFPAYDYQADSWFRDARKALAPIWGEPYIDQGFTDAPMVTYSVPILRGEQFIGVLTLDISLQALSQAQTGIGADTRRWSARVGASSPIRAATGCSRKASPASPNGRVWWRWKQSLRRA